MSDFSIKQIGNLLGQGYGVEDIALKLKCDVSIVRDEVAFRRAEESLPTTYYRMRQRMRKAAGKQPA